MPFAKPTPSRSANASTVRAATVRASTVRASCTLGVLTASLLYAQAQAQTPPDAGRLQQQIEREQQPLLPPKLPPAAAILPPRMRALSGQTLTVTQFRFVGNTRLTAQQLGAAVAPYLNREVDFSQLEAAASAVAKAYRDAGWVVRTYLPAQDIAAGVVTIQVVEAVFGKVVLQGSGARLVNPEVVLRMFEAQQPSGALLNAEALDRALLLADDLPGVSVVGSMQEGASEGETDLLVKLSDEPRYVGDVSLDNTGARSTGAKRINANFSVNSPLGLGDLFSLNASKSSGSDYLRLSQTMSLGSSGLRVGANVSRLQYKLVSAEFSALGAKGTADSAGLEANYPVLRARTRNLFASLGVDSKKFSNHSAGAAVSVYSNHPVTIGLNGNAFDELGGGGANSASLSLAHGSVNLNGSPSQASDAATVQAAGAYSKWRYALSRQQMLGDSLALYAAWAGQWAAKNLDSSEKFYLGGVYGVRAYPSSEAGGAIGQMLNLELRQRLAGGVNLTAFYDIGHVRINADNQFSGASALNDYSLKGAGLATGWQMDSGASIKATWARRIGANPRPTAKGSDQDGSLVRDRFWLSASLPFSF
jgi:hemolysin activation/secretion protein